jgi:hypothetical protein
VSSNAAARCSDEFPLLSLNYVLPFHSDRMRITTSKLNSLQKAV